MKLIVAVKTDCLLLDQNYGPDPCSTSGSPALYASFIEPGTYEATRTDKVHREIARPGPFVVIKTQVNGTNRTFVFDKEKLQAALQPKQGPPQIIIEE